MKVFVDKKEPKEIAGLLMQHFQDVEYKSLGTDSGDILVQLDTEDLMLIERKRVPDDVCASIADGRLFRQCENITKIARFSFLILDGEFKLTSDGFIMSVRRYGLQKTGWHIDHVQGALVRAQMYGVMVLQETFNFGRRVKLLAELCERADKVHIARKPLIKSVFDGDLQRKADFIAQLRGIGFERAKSLIDATGDVPLIEMIMFAVNSGELALPKNWGLKVQQNLRESLGIKPSQKLKLAQRSEWKEAV